MQQLLLYLLQPRWPMRASQAYAMEKTAADHLTHRRRRVQHRPVVPRHLQYNISMTYYSQDGVSVRHWSALTIRAWRPDQIAGLPRMLVDPCAIRPAHSSTQQLSEQRVALGHSHSIN